MTAGVREPDPADHPVGSTEVPPAESADVTVVMITKDRRAEAVEAVTRLLALPARPPIVVVDNGSRDGTVSVLTHPGRFDADTDDLRVIALDRNIGAAARNLGVEIATTPYVAFCDDDSTWVAGSLPRAAEVLRDHPRIGLLAGRIEVGADGRIDPTCLEMARSPLPAEDGLPGPMVLGFVACAAIVRREAFIDSGGFDPRLGIGGEETPLAIELASRGWALSYVDDVVARHVPSPIREPDERRRLLARNRLWTTWLRRRGRSVASETLAVVRDSIRDPAVRRGTLAALVSLPAVLRRRRPVTPDLETRLRLLD